jgi:hypothetical protein
MDPQLPVIKLDCYESLHADAEQLGGLSDHPQRETH